MNWHRLTTPMLAGGMTLAALSWFPRALTAAPVELGSSRHQTSLLELYTSEGCSSCPPAENWLSKLKDSAGLWRDFVPVAFHVDYWNYLGWRDPWSQEAAADRQREYARQWGSANIYTPELVLNGAEWQRPVWSHSLPETGLKDAGVLKASSADGWQWQVTYSAPAGSPRVYELHSALLVSGVGSEVTAGENAGRHLSHDFVALIHNEQPLVGKTNDFRGSFRIDPGLKPTTGRLALAVWVVPNGQAQPAQAVGGWLP